jgi:hypothetical protein
LSRAGAAANSVWQYALGTAYDVSTGTYDSKTVSVNTEDGTPTGLDFSDDGTVMIVGGEAGAEVNQYTLGTAWDVSSATADTTLDVGAWAPKGVRWAPGGLGVYVAKYAVGYYGISYFPLTTAWDLSTGASTNVHDIYGSDRTGGWIGMAFKPDGSRFYGLDEYEAVNEYQRQIPNTDLAAMSTLSFNVEYRMSGAVTDDDYDLTIRVMCGTKVLAAAASDGTLQAAASNITATTDTSTGETAFTYVNTAASRHDWLNAEIELKQTYTEGGGSGDGRFIEVDRVAITGLYTT